MLAKIARLINYPILLLTLSSSTLFLVLGAALVSPSSGLAADDHKVYLPAVSQSGQTETITIYSDLADGEVLNRWCNSDWNSCRNASMGNARWEGLTVGTVGATLEAGGDYTIERIFFFFDTSSIPTNAQITGATLNVYAGQYQQGNKTIHVARSTANIPLTIADFSKVEFVSGGSTAPSSPYTWMSINLNAVALDWIVKGGMTKLALVHHMDLNNIEPTAANDVLVALAEDAQHRAYLVITYSTTTASGIVSEARFDIGVPIMALKN
jgi:hypothetical protein